MTRPASRRFVVAVTALTAGLLGLFAMVDAGRPWRSIQHDFFQRESDALERRLAEELESQSSELAALEAAVEVAEERFDGRRREAATLTTRLRQLDHESWRAEQRRLEAEEAGDPTEAQDSRREIEALAELRQQQRDQLAALSADLDAARRALTEAQKPIRPLRERLAELDAASWWRGIPWLGRFAPPIAVRSLEPEIARAPVGGPPTTERCVTCHLTTVREDLSETNWPPPLRPHPRPDLYLAEDSPHPASVFGCVSCHRGDGRATDFGRAGHAPRDAAQAQDWRDRLGDGAAVAEALRMLPMDLVEAGCGGCHTRATGLAETPSLDVGRGLRRQLGCDGCHRDSAEGEHHRHLAPSLTGLPRKTERYWLAQRLAAAETHPGFAPAPFQPAATGPAVDSDGRTTAVAAMVRALWAIDPASDLGGDTEAAPPTGDPERGRQLFDTLGCRACHGFESTTPTATAELLPTPGVGPSRGRNVAWLFAFLRDPQAVEPGTRMPDPRLTVREAADLAAALRGPEATESTSPVPEVDRELRDRWLLALFESEGTLEASARRLTLLDDDARTLALGRHLLEAQGCHGCHAIPGLEGASAPVEPWTREALEERVATVFRHPRLELSLTPENDRALRIALLAEPAHRVPEPGRADVDRDENRGAALIAELGCRGCHAFEGRPSTLSRSGIAAGDGIPALDQVGSKLHPSWLTTALRDPGEAAVRPWLTVRMPRYRLTAAEIDLLVRTLSGPSVVPWVVEEPPTPDDRTLAAGRALFEMMQCDGCHYGTETIVPGPPAPDYGNSRRRLRPAWVVAWILDPERFVHDSGMPSRFLGSGHGSYDSSFLVGSLEMPMFGAQHRRLRRAFDDDEAMLSHLEDPLWVARAVRAHLWTKTPGSSVVEAAAQVDP